MPKNQPEIVWQGIHDGEQMRIVRIPTGKKRSSRSTKAAPPVSVSRSRGRPRGRPPRRVVDVSGDSIEINSVQETNESEETFNYIFEIADHKDALGNLQYTSIFDMDKHSFKTKNSSGSNSVTVVRFFRSMLDGMSSVEKDNSSKKFAKNNIEI